MRAKIILLIALIAASTTKGYAADLVSGDLGYWLRTSAEPALLSMVNTHPRFRGETIDVSGLSGGKPGSLMNGLDKLLGEQIRSKLIARTSARVPLGARHACGFDNANILLGIEVSRVSRERHRVLLAFVDTVDNLWINRSPQVWVGRLTTEQKYLLQDADTVSEHHFADEPTSVAAALLDQLDCSTPLEAPVYVDSRDALGNAFTSLLKESPRYAMALTDDRGEAETVLHLDPLMPGPVGLHYAGYNQPIRVGEVMVRERPAPQPALTEIREAKRKDHCLGHGDRCIDINYDLTRPAYLLEFVTKRGNVMPLSCELPERSDPGLKSHGLKVPTTDHPLRPGLGYYVIATPDRHTATALHTELMTATSRCGARTPTQTLQSFVANIGHLLNQSHTFWEAVHLVADNNQARIM